MNIIEELIAQSVIAPIDATHFGYKPYPQDYASKSVWKKRGRIVPDGSVPLASATRRPKGSEQSSKRYDLFHLCQTKVGPLGVIWERTD